VSVVHAGSNFLNSTNISKSVLKTDP